MKQQDISFLVRVISNAIDREVNRELEQFDITIRQGKFLGYLHENGDRTVTQKELQDSFEISHPTTVGIVKRLESKGFVRTRPDPNDRRWKIVELAAGEAKVHRKILSLHDQIESELYRGFTEEDRKQLLTLLHRVYRNLDFN